MGLRVRTPFQGRAPHPVLRLATGVDVRSPATDLDGSRGMGVHDFWG